MRASSLLCAALLSAGSAGCDSHATPVPPPSEVVTPSPKPPPPDGSSGGGTAGGSAGMSFFFMSVGPTLQTTCATCHAHIDSGAPIFMGATPAATYVTMLLYGGIIAAPSNSLLTHHGTHAGPDLTGEQRQLVDAWLKKEVSGRGLAMGDAGLTLEVALSQIGACMSFSDWTANGLDALPSADTNGDGACSACHSTGDGGAFLSADAKATFAQNQQFPFVSRWARGDITPQGVFNGLTARSTWTAVGSESCAGQSYNCHPPYQLPKSLGDGLDAFMSATLARWKNGQCNAP